MWLCFLCVQAKPAKRQYAAVAKAISQFEPVTMWADPSVAEEAKSYLADAPNVTVQVDG
jgi:agmatine deiminase